MGKRAERVQAKRLAVPVLVLCLWVYRCQLGSGVATAAAGVADDPSDAPSWLVAPACDGPAPPAV